AALRRRTTADWAQTLTAAGVPNGPVYEVAEALVDPQTAARGDIVAIDHPRFGPVRQVASPLRLSGPQAPGRRARVRGEPAEEILGRVCGYDDGRIAALRSAGVFGAPAAAAAS